MSTPTLDEIKQQALLLSEGDRKALTDFLIAQTKAASEDGKRGEPRDFSRDMEWIKQNRTSYRGQFVALKEGRLIAHGEKEREVWKASAGAGVNNPFLAYIEAQTEETFGGW